MCSVVASPQRYVLCDDDLASLEPREFVHDNVINFYLDKWSSARRLERRGRYHILSTQCVPYIISHANDTGKIKRNCEKMAKTYGDITQKDWLFFPVNVGPRQDKSFAVNARHRCVWVGNRRCTPGPVDSKRSPSPRLRNARRRPQRARRCHVGRPSPFGDRSASRRSSPVTNTPMRRSLAFVTES